MAKMAPLPLRLMRALRPRLTLTYVLFFSLLLMLVGVLVRQRLSNILEARTHEILDEEWAAVKGYLRIEKGKPIWFYDTEDPEESAIVERLRRDLLLARPNGEVLEVSNAYRAMGIEGEEEIARIMKSPTAVFRIKQDTLGNRVLVRYGTLIDSRRSYFLAVGRHIEDLQDIENRFTRDYFTFVPVMIALIAVIGWFVAARALGPVDDLAHAAKRITGSNLNLRIPTRGANDEIDNLIETFNSMMDRLEGSFEQIRQFSTDVSHELRTPLTAIRGQLEVALMTANTAEQYREAMLNSLQDVERLSNIVRALLMLSRAESGQLALQMDPIDLSSLTADVVEEFELAAEEAGLELTSELTPGVVVPGDKVQIERMLFNLISNAVKYTPRGGTLKVVVEQGHEIDGKPAAMLIVEDNGRGIPKEYLPHIFDRFYRVPGEKDPEKGLGLGLSFVAWIVKAHHARIDVDSEPGVGTRFKVTIPVAEVGTTHHAEETAPTSDRM